MSGFYIFGLTQSRAAEKPCAKHRILFCCTCRYGNTGHHHESPNEDEPRDLIYEIGNTTIKQKIREFSSEFNDELELTI